MLFQSYKKLISSIFSGLTSGKQTATIGDYFKVVGTTLLVVLIVVGAIALVCGAVWLPKFLVHKTTQNVCAQLVELDKISPSDWTPENDKERKQLNAKLKRIRIIDCVVIGVVYIPVVIPLALILMDLVLLLF